MKLQKALYWERLFAWLVDMVIIMIITSILTGNWAPSSILKADNYLILGTIAFLYWTILESAFGQGAGKKIMKIRTSAKNDKPMNMQQAAIQSFGKAFLLPIDIIAGLLYQQKEKTRVFNILSDTVVVKE